MFRMAGSDVASSNSYSSDHLTDAVGSRSIRVALQLCLAFTRALPSQSALASLAQPAPSCSATALCLLLVLDLGYLDVDRLLLVLRLTRRP